jgi:hypothetical protein
LRKTKGGTVVRFTIRRASDFNGVPCGEAIRVEDFWEVEIATLDALLAFVDKHGDVIVEQGEPPSLMIYDGCLE